MRPRKKARSRRPGRLPGKTHFQTSSTTSLQTPKPDFKPRPDRRLQRCVYRGGRSAGRAGMVPKLPPDNQEILRRRLWYRQEVHLWNEANGSRPMPQPSDFGLTLPDLNPSEIFWPGGGR